MPLLSRTMFSVCFCVLLSPPSSGALAWDWIGNQCSEARACLKMPLFHLHSSILALLGLDALLAQHVEGRTPLSRPPSAAAKMRATRFGITCLLLSGAQIFPLPLQCCCSTGACREWIHFPFSCLVVETYIQSKGSHLSPMLKNYQCFPHSPPRTSMICILSLSSLLHVSPSSFPFLLSILCS